MHDIPYALICVGCKQANLFSEDDKQLACTFADAISEFIRLERIFHAVANSRKIIIMKDSTELLEKLNKINEKIQSEGGKLNELE